MSLEISQVNAFSLILALSLRNEIYTDIGGEENNVIHRKTTFE